MNAERYQRDLEALTECAVRGVSIPSLEQLMIECGIDQRDREKVINWAKSDPMEEVL